jgi:hypothetical protein
VLSYSRFIHAIEPEGGQAPDGMARITPRQVLARIEPYLNAAVIPAEPGAKPGESRNP